MTTLDMAGPDADMGDVDMTVEAPRRRTDCPASERAACMLGQCCVRPPTEAPIPDLAPLDGFRVLVDGRDQIHLLYHSAWTLHHALWDGTTWTHTALVSATEGVAPYTRDDYDAKLDSKNQLHVIYHDHISKTPVYRLYAQGGWSSPETIEECSARIGCGRHNALALGDDDKVFVVYQTRDTTLDDLTFARLDGDVWSSRSIPGFGNDQLKVVEAVYNGGAVHIVTRRVQGTRSNTVMERVLEADGAMTHLSELTWPNINTEGTLHLIASQGVAWLLFRDTDTQTLRTVRYDPQVVTADGPEVGTVSDSAGTRGGVLHAPSGSQARMNALYLRRPGDASGEAKLLHARRAPAENQRWLEQPARASYPDTGDLFAVGMNDIKRAHVFIVDESGALAYRHVELLAQ